MTHLPGSAARIGSCGSNVVKAAEDEYVREMDNGAQIHVDFAPDDVAISRLHGIAFGEESGGVASWTERLRRHSVTWVGAFHGDELVAFVHIVGDGGSHGFLLDTAVHPSHQRKGLGVAVVAAAVERAKAAGCEWVHVDFEPHLESFYRAACGFQATSAGLLRL